MVTPDSIEHKQQMGTPVRELLKNAMPQSDELVKRVAAVVDSHTRFLDNMSVINNLNLSVQIISSVVMTIPDWKSSESRCKSLVQEYMQVFVDESTSNVNDKMQQIIKGYVVSSCMIHYAVATKDRDLLLSYNKEVNNAVREILAFINNPATKNQAPKIEDSNANV